MINRDTNIVSLLHERAKQSPHKIAYVFLKDGKENGSNLTYGELDRKARAIATALQSQVNPGERALLLYSSSEEFLPAFFGCLYAGIIAVPTPAIDAVRMKRSLPRLEAIAKDSQASSILTTFGLAEQIQQEYSKITGLQSIQLLVTDAIDFKNTCVFEATIKHENLAYLQYTSGSTSTPKGVMITHHNLIDNMACINKAYDYNEASVVANWMPYFHDYALVMQLIHSLYAGIPCYEMSPITFIKRPIRWLEAISRYRVTHTAAPNFAYDYCVSQIQADKLNSIDLSSWRVAHTGAEPIRPDTLLKFAQTFEPYGFNFNRFYPAYGLAEATLIVTTKKQLGSPVFLTISSVELANNKVLEVIPNQNKIETQTITSCGYSIEKLEVVIVNPQTLIQCAADEVGEIWVKSKSVALGYWNRPEATKQTFEANLPNFPGISFLRTGDLGFLKDGQLFVTGRLKDLIVIRGKNYYPQDIELTVEKSHSQLRANHCAVFSIDVDRVERLVVAAEVDSRSDKNLHPDEIIAAVTHAVAQFELPLHAVVLLKRGSIPKTSSGKIQRHACRNGFLANSLSVISSSIHTQSDRHTEIQEILIQHPNVEQVVVNKTGDRHNLIAYIVPTQEKVPTVGDIRDFIDRRLSETETISFVLLEALPLKPDGAIDFDALPIPQRTRSTQNYVSPRNPLEQKLANIWAEVLWIEHVSIDDNFFVLGGSSLLAVTAIAKIEEELSIEFTSENLPQLSTIADLTPVVEEILDKKSNLSEAIDSQFTSEYRQILTYVAGWKGERVTNSIVGLNTQGSHQPIFWCLQGFRELSQLAKYLGEDQPIYGMRSGHLVMEYTPENIKALAAIYVEEILSVCSEPYILGGNCQSAWIIWEVAQQLIGKGKTITLLCLMEQFIPQTYSGKIALFFGRESKYNPYKRFVYPELGISKFYKDFSLDVFPGKHGQFFNEPNIQILTRQIAKAIAQAQINSQGDRLLPPQAYNAKLSTDSLDIAAGESSTILVRVENISTVTWKETDVSGIRLGNHWLDESGKVVCWCDGVANLDRELTPQAAIDLHLRVTAPKKPGSYKLELDLVEEGVTWFKDKGSETAVVDVEVFSPQPELQKSQKIDISPEYDLESLRQQGHLCFERGDFVSAIAFYQSAIKLAPQQPSQVYQNLGMALSDREDFDAAIIAYNKALELEADNAELYYLLAKAQAKQGLLSEAAISYYKAIELQPKPWFYSDLGSLLLRLNRFTEAVEIYDRAIELNDRDPVLYIKLGSAQIKADRPEIGVQSYATAIELNPDRTEVYTKRMGDELCQQGNFEAALSAYRRSLAINPRQHKVYIALGNALSRLNQTEDAIALYREAIALNPEHAALYSSLGNARRKIGDRNGAIKSYRRSLELNPRQYQTSIALGNTLCKNKNWTEATAVFERAIELKPRHFKAYNGFANAQHKQGNLQAALAAYRRCLELNPRSFNTYVAFGNTLSQANQTEEAIEAYSKAIELSPQPPFNIYLKLGDCLSKQGLIQDAIASYQTALELKPNSEAILTRIHNLKQELKSIASGDRVKLLKKDTFVICVLGMHRSGTSCLAGSLQAAGIPGGKVNQYATDNIRGNRENKSILALNKKILADNNGAWNFPPNTLNYSLEHQQERDLLVKELSSYSVWMFKDPRTVLTLPFWQEGIAYLQPIATFRHPLKVAMSLNRRQESVPLRDGLKLWIHYNSLILKAFDKSPFPLICFDLPQPEYLAQLTKVIDELNNNLDLELAKSQVSKFYESTLIDRENTAILSPTPEDKQLLDRAESIYQELREKAGLQANFKTVRSSLLVPLEESLTAYLQAIKFQADNWQLHFMLAKMQHEEGDIKDAIASSRTALKLNPDNIDIVEQLSQLLIESERVDEAIILLEQLLDSQPENPRIYLFLVKILRQYDRTEAAIKSYQKAVELIPYDLTSQVHLGRLLLQNNQNNEAISHYKQALRQHPQSHQIYFDLGKAHFKQKAWKLAISNYKKAIELNDTSAAVYIHLANAYKQQGNKRQALKTYRHAIASNPNNVRGYVALGNFYRQQKKWTRAIDNYQKAIALNCQNAGVYFALGECWRQKRNWTKAIDSYQKALNLDYHKSFELYKVIGDTLTELNEINSAISAYQKAMKINPDSSEVKNSLRAVDRKLNCI